MVTNSKEIEELIKAGELPAITDENYYSPEINAKYMSFHTWLSLYGCAGIIPCEARAIAEMKGEYVDEEANDTSLMVGSYVDSVLAGSEEEHEKFKRENPSIFTYEKTPNLELITMRHPEWISGKGNLKSTMSMKKIEEADPECLVTRVKGLKSDYVMANKMIARCRECEKFMWYMSGEKQRIFTGIIEGIPFKGKIDSYKPAGQPIIVDLKTTKDVHKMSFVPDLGHIDFVTYYGYVFQLAIYKELVRQCTGESCDCFITAVSKNKHPERKIIGIDGSELFDGLSTVKSSLAGSLPKVWRGEIQPTRCERPSCPYCLDTEKVTEVVDHRDLIITF